MFLQTSGSLLINTLLYCELSQNNLIELIHCEVWIWRQFFAITADELFKVAASHSFERLLCSRQVLLVAQLLIRNPNCKNGAIIWFCINHQLWLMYLHPEVALLILNTEGWIPQTSNVKTTWIAIMHVKGGYMLYLSCFPCSSLLPRPELMHHQPWGCGGP